MTTERLHIVLKDDGALKALLGMADSGNTDVVAQVARGLANFAKCESRRIVQGFVYYIVQTNTFIIFFSSVTR